MKDQSAGRVQAEREAEAHHSDFREVGGGHGDVWRQGECRFGVVSNPDSLELQEPRGSANPCLRGRQKMEFEELFLVFSSLALPNHKQFLNHPELLQQVPGHI